MKGLLYLFTILFNATGTILSINLFYLTNKNNTIYLPIIIIGILIFGFSFIITLFDFQNNKKFKKNYKINKNYFMSH